MQTIEVNEDPRGLFELAYETKVIIDLLKAAKDGETVTYKQMLEATERTSVNAIRGNINTARRALQDEGYLFDTVRREGVKRMSDEDIATSGTRHQRHIKRTAQKAIKEQGAIRDFGALSAAGRYASLVTQTIMATIAHATSSKASKQIDADVKARQEQLTIGQTLEAFKKV